MPIHVIHFSFFVTSRTASKPRLTSFHIVFQNPLYVSSRRLENDLSDDFGICRDVGALFARC
jgi:hypothetical protein